MKKLDNSFFRFLIVGVINTIVGTGIMFAFYNLLHFSYWVSTASNYIVGSIVSYFLNKYFTFRSRERSVAVILRFIVNIAVCYFAAYGLARPLVRAALSNAGTTVQENIAMLAGMAIFVFMNYFGQRLFVFRNRQTD